MIYVVDGYGVDKIYNLFVILYIYIHKVVLYLICCGYITNFRWFRGTFTHTIQGYLTGPGQTHDLPK